MNAIYSLKTTKFQNHCSGYNSYDDFRDSLELSVRLLKRSNTVDDIVFYADKASYEHIKTIKHLFDDIIVNLDEINWVEDQNWAFNKLHIYKDQIKPFYHIDNDVYIEKGLPKLFTESCDFFFQGRELLNIHPYYKQTVDSVGNCIDDKMLPYMPSFAVNCGVAGFNDLSILQDYYENAKRFVINNQNEKFNEFHITHHLCILFEQLFVVPLIEKKNVNYILTDDFKEVAIEYKHLLSDSKRQESNMVAVRKKLNELK